MLEQQYKTLFEQQYKTLLKQQYKTLLKQQYKTLLKQQYKTLLEQQYKCAMLYIISVTYGQMNLFSVIIILVSFQKYFKVKLKINGSIILCPNKNWIKPCDMQNYFNFNKKNCWFHTWTQHTKF